MDNSQLIISYCGCWQSANLSLTSLLETNGAPTLIPCPDSQQIRLYVPSLPQFQLLYKLQLKMWKWESILWIDLHNQVPSGIDLSLDFQEPDHVKNSESFQRRFLTALAMCVLRSVKCWLEFWPNSCDLATDSPQTDTIKQQSDLRPRVARAKVLARVGIRNRPRNSLLTNQQYVYRFYSTRTQHPWRR